MTSGVSFYTKLRWTRPSNIWFYKEFYCSMIFQTYLTLEGLSKLIFVWKSNTRAGTSSFSYKNLPQNRFNKKISSHYLNKSHLIKTYFHIKTWWKQKSSLTNRYNYKWLLKTDLNKKKMFSAQKLVQTKEFEFTQTNSCNMRSFFLF